MVVVGGVCLQAGAAPASTPMVMVEGTFLQAATAPASTPAVALEDVGLQDEVRDTAAAASDCSADWCSPFVRRESANQAPAAGLEAVAAATTPHDERAGDARVFKVRVFKVRVRVDIVRDLVDQVEFHVTGETPTVKTYGGNRGQQCADFDLKPGEWLTAVLRRQGNSLDAVRFETNTGRQSQWYGNQSGGRAMPRLAAPAGQTIVGLVRPSGGCCPGIQNIVCIVSPRPFLPVRRESADQAPAAGLAAVAAATMSRDTKSPTAVKERQLSFLTEKQKKERKKERKERDDTCCDFLGCCCCCAAVQCLDVECCDVECCDVECCDVECCDVES